jgi:hypothetical protein
VSSPHRVITRGLLLKRYDLVRDSLEHMIGLTVQQRGVVLQLLRYWAYYGLVYPKACQVSSEMMCSRSTFWRTIKLLEGRGLLTRVNRFIIRPHAQISNLYRFDRLLIVIARYLAEHCQVSLPAWLDPILALATRRFCGMFLPESGSRSCVAGESGP